MYEVPSPPGRQLWAMATATDAVLSSHCVPDTLREAYTILNQIPRGKYMFCHFFIWENEAWKVA